MRPLNRRISPMQALAVIASLGVVPFGAGPDVPPPELQRQKPILGGRSCPSTPPAPHGPTKHELTAADKRARKAAKRKAER